MKLFIFSTLLLSLSQLFGAENNFSITFNDIHIKVKNTVGSPLLVRTYNSSVKKAGLFGIGWCSNIETKLFFTKSTIALSPCGFGEEEIFSQVSNKNIFISKSNPLRIIELRDKTYSLSAQEKILMKFNYEGFLIAENKPTGENVVLNYSPENKLVSFDVNPGGRVSLGYQKDKIKFSSKLFDYDYRFVNNTLVSVHENGKVMSSYEYTSSGELVAYKDQELLTQVKKSPLATESSIQSLKNSSVDRDALGQPKIVKSKTHQTEYVWKDKKVVKIIETDMRSNAKLQISYIYDKAGKVVAANYESAIRGKFSFTYQYDNKDFLRNIVVNKQNIFIKRQPATLQVETLSSHSQLYNFSSPSDFRNSNDLLKNYELGLRVLVKSEVAY